MTTIRKSARVVQAFGASLLLAATLLLVACGSDSSGSSGGGSQITVRPLSAEFGTRKAVAYSGFRGASNGSPMPSDAEVLEDMTLLHSEGFGLIRMFSSGPHTAQVLQVLHANPGLDIKMQLGIWISGADAGNHAANYADMDAGIALATNPAYAPLILAVSVGNETMIDWSMHLDPTEMLTNITYVRDRVTQPVTTDDNWAFFRGQSTSGGLFNTLPIVRNIDFVSMHTYAILDTPYGLWDWKQEGVAEGPNRAVAMMDASIAWTKWNFSSVRTYLKNNDIDIPIVIGETGWKSFPSKSETQRAHPVNQKMYIDRLNAWNALPKTANTPLNIVYFEAFDETWKGNDDMWGLWDVNRKRKYVLYWDDVYNAGTDVAPEVSSADAQYYHPVVIPEVTANKYIVFSEESVDAGEVTATSGAAQWGVWSDGTNSASSADSSDVPAGGGDHSVEITPTPRPWGWGVAVSVPEPADDMSNFTSGHLHVSIKTTYPGKLEMGFLTGPTSELNGTDVYKPIADGQYGYENDGAWHDVSIPIADLVPYAHYTYGQPAAVLNMNYLQSPFVIADRLANTLNPSTSTNHVWIDNIYWTRD